MESKKLIYTLENLGCAHCAAKMEEQISHLSGVEHAVISFPTKQLRIYTDQPQDLLPQIQKICSSIESQVLVRPVEEGASHSSEPDAQKNHDLWIIGIGTLLFLAGILSSAFGLSHKILLSVYLAAYIFLGAEILLEAVKNLSHGQIFDENFLMGIATIGAFLIQEYPEAVGIMLFYRIGEYFEEKAVERSRSQIMDALDMRPETVQLITGQQIRQIPAEDAVPGDLLLIRPGDRIPLDGVIVSGESRIDTSPITGEPVPVFVKSGDFVTSGCMNTNGQLKIRVEKVLAESMVSRILDSVENAAASKPKLDRFITKFSKIYTPCVILLAVGTAIIPSLFTGNWNYWIYTALSFLVMSCPCALVLSVPLAFFSGIGVASKKKILLKGGASLEFLSRLGAVVMDKTGTITAGNFRVQQILPGWKYSESEILQICASCEQFSTHPIASSILTAAKEQDLMLKRPVMLKEKAGYGISCYLPEGQILCGNKKLLEEHGIMVPSIPGPSHSTEIYLGIDGRYAGAVFISDTIKPDAADAIRQLKDMGLHTVMLTGDSQESAKAVAKQTGIETVYAKLLPEEKLQILQTIRETYGPVFFIGDGINDAPVLAGADVSAAMGTGADAALEAADAVFLTSAVTSIPEAIHIAKQTNGIAIQNVVFALTVKILVMILGLCGFANMWMAVFADTGVAMICVLNSIRLLYKKS